MPTIYDVAKKADVSRMTVSRVINNSDLVKEETRRKVLEAIKELNFRPNLLAQSLVTKRTHTIAHVMASISNPFHPKVVQGIEDCCYEKGYSVVICNANEKAKEQEYIDILKDKCIDGVIFHHLNITEEQAVELERNNIRCVVIDNENILENAQNVVTDDEKGAYLATKHLISLGHKNIGTIYNKMQFDPDMADMVYEETFQFNIWKQRMTGFLKAMKEAGLKVNPKFQLESEGGGDKGIKSGNLSMKRLIGGREGAKQFLEMQDRPTAIYAQNDLLAIGAINAMIECGLSVPEHCSIIGHDGLEMSEILYPRLSTIEQPRYKMGFLAAQMLISSIENNCASQNMYLEPELVVRESTGAANI